jgi:hypothetical protein
MEPGFRSILSPAVQAEPVEDPEYFPDLNLDQV